MAFGVEEGKGLGSIRVVVVEGWWKGSEQPSAMLGAIEYVCDGEGPPCLVSWAVEQLPWEKIVESRGTGIK